MPERDELRGVLNTGHRRGGYVLRVVGDEHEPRQFATFAPCAIALIGRLPDTLGDRSIVISLRRRRRDEHVERFSERSTGHLELLAQQCARWAHDNEECVSGAEPHIPGALFNRTADNWHALLAIADVAGGEWPERARRAAAHLAGSNGDDQSILAILLADIRTVFVARGIDRAGALPSADLVAALVEMEGHPWADMRGGRPLNKDVLARLLKPIRIVPVQHRVGDRRARGYQPFQFDDAWER